MIVVDHRGERTEMPESALIGPFEGGYDNENETAHWYELYLCRCHGEIVKKSLWLFLKKGVVATSEVGSIG